MAGSLSDAGENAALDALVSSTHYLALCTTAPTDSALGTELAAGNGYARQSVSWAAASAGSKATNAAITFGPFTTDFGNVTHLMLMDAASGGTAANMKFYWTADAAKDPANGDSITIASGALSMSLT